MPEKTRVLSDVPTLDAANLSYAFEAVSVNQPEISEEDIKGTVDSLQRYASLPKNLEYLDRFYDAPTGTSRAAFRVKGTEEIIGSIISVVGKSHERYYRAFWVQKKSHMIYNLKRLTGLSTLFWTHL